MMKTLYCNGTILTMENALTAEAVLEEDGLIRAVGSLEELKPLAGDARIRDLEGCTMLPAFIDAHSHFSACANAMLQVPLDEAVTFEEIKERIAAYIKEKQIPKGAWVMAKGYDHNQLEEKDHPRRQVLDEVSPDHPLVLQHRSGHVGVFNTSIIWHPRSDAR